MTKFKNIDCQVEDIETASLYPKREISVRTKAEHKKEVTSHKRCKVVLLGVFIFLSGYAFATSLFFHRFHYHIHGHNHLDCSIHHGHNHPNDYSVLPDEMKSINEKTISGGKMVGGSRPMKTLHTDHHMRPRSKKNSYRDRMRDHPKDYWNHEPPSFFSESISSSNNSSSDSNSMDEQEPDTDMKYIIPSTSESTIDKVEEESPYPEIVFEPRADHEKIDAIKGSEKEFEEQEEELFGEFVRREYSP